MANLVAYKLARTSCLTPFEFKVLHYITSYSKECRASRMDLIAQSLGYSERHVRRTIKELTLKGLVIKKYTYYKRCILKAQSLDYQKKWIHHKASVISETVRNLWINTKKKRKQIVNPDRTSMSESIKSTKENLRDYQSQGKIGDMLGIKSVYEVHDQHGFSLELTRQRQIQALLDYQKTW